MQGKDQVPRFARPFVAAFIAAMAAAALFVWEPWPFTSFRLFSQLRIDEQTAWEIRAADGGEEEDLPLTGELRGFVFQIREFVGASAGRQDELCRVWASAAPEIVGHPTDEVRIYQRTWRLSARRGDEALPGTTRLTYMCDATGAHAAG